MTLDELVVVSREVGGQLAALGVPIDLESADKIGEPPRAPQWAVVVWEVIKMDLLFGELKNGGPVTEAVNRLFQRLLRDAEFKTSVVVIMRCLDDMADQVKALFDFSYEGCRSFCPRCRLRLVSFVEIRRELCDRCNWHDSHYKEFE